MVRASAAVALGIMGERRAIDLLVVALRDSNASLRMHAADALGRIGDERAIGPLIAAFKDDDVNVATYAMHGLNKLGELSFQPLLDALHDEDSRVRQQAAHALGWREDHRVAAPLIHLLRGDADIAVRRAAAYNLTRTGDAGIRHLIDALADHDPYVRGFAAAALGEAAVEGKLLAGQAVDPLRDLLDDENTEVRRAAASTLRMLGYWTSMPTELRRDAYVSTVYADHHQFFFCDRTFDGLPDSGDDERHARRLSVGPPSCINVFTKSYDFVPVAVEVVPGPPEGEFAGWSHVAEASLEAASGGIVFGELFEDDFGEPKLRVRPGIYRVRIYYGNLDNAVFSIGDDDYYRFVMWPAASYEEPRVLHSESLSS